MPVNISGFISALAAYMAAVYPAGPEPIIIHVWILLESDIDEIGLF